MIKKWLSLALIFVLSVVSTSSFALAQTGSPANPNSSVAAIKAEVARLGATGEKKRIEVKMQDGSKRKGHVSQAGEDSFTLVDSKTNQTVSIFYTDVAQVKKAGPKGDTIALWIIGGAAAVGAVVLGSLLLQRCRNEGGC